MAIVIVGGSGWASRAAEWCLINQFQYAQEEFQIFGSRLRKEFFETREYVIREWIPQRIKTHISLFLPFAFLTVDKFEKFGRVNFEQRNRELIQKSIEFISLNKPDKCVIFSSGMVNPELDILPRSEAYRIYSQLKMEEENAISDACRKSKTNLVICRLFSASGRHIVEPNRFALGNFILQATQNSKIEVKSKFPIYRRYVDMAQLIEICVKLSDKYNLVEFESGGTLVEISQLAKMIGKEFRCEVHTSQNIDSEKCDNYYSGSHKMEEYANLLRVDILSLEQQIKETIYGIHNMISKSEKK